MEEVGIELEHAFCFGSNTSGQVSCQHARVKSFKRALLFLSTMSAISNRPAAASACQLWQRQRQWRCSTSNSQVDRARRRHSQLNLPLESTCSSWQAHLDCYDFWPSAGCNSIHRITYLLGHSITIEESTVAFGECHHLSS